MKVDYQDGWRLLLAVGVAALLWLAFSRPAEVKVLPPSDGAVVPIEKAPRWLAAHMASPDLSEREILTMMAASDELPDGPSEGTRADEIWAAVRAHRSTDEEVQTYYDQNRDAFGERSVVQCAESIRRILALRAVRTRLEAGDVTPP